MICGRSVKQLAIFLSSVVVVSSCGGAQTSDAQDVPGAAEIFEITTEAAAEGLGNVTIKFYPAESPSNLPLVLSEATLGEKTCVAEGDGKQCTISDVPLNTTVKVFVRGKNKNGFGPRGVTETYAVDVQSSWSSQQAAGNPPADNSSSSKSSTTTSITPKTNSSATTAPARYKCPTGTWSFAMTGLRVNTVLPTLDAAYNNYLFEMVGTFTNSTNAIVFPNSMSAQVSFSPNPNSWSSANPRSPATLNVFINEGMEVAPGDSVTVSGSGTLESSSTPRLAGHSARVMWNDPKDVAYCAAPTKG